MKKSNQSVLLITNQSLDGGEKSETIWSIAKHYFTLGYEVFVRLVKGKGDAEEYVEEYGDDVDMIICNNDQETMEEIYTGIERNKLTLPVCYFPV